MSPAGIPKDPVKRIRELLAAGEVDKAYKLCRETFSGRALEPDDLVLFGQVLAAQGKTQEAEAALRDALRKDGAHGPAALILAGILVGTERADEGTVLLRALLKRQPDNPAALSVLGISLCRMAQSEGESERRAQLFIEAEDALNLALATGAWEEGTVTSLAASQAARGLRSEALATLEEGLNRIAEPARSRLRILGDLLLYQIIWEQFDACEATASRMGQEAGRDEVALEGVTLHLAGEARRMATAGPEWQRRALVLADLLEGLR